MLSRLLTTFTKLTLQIFCSPIFCNTYYPCFECHFKMLTSLFLLLSFWHTAHLYPFFGYHHHFRRRHYHHYPMSTLYLFSHILFHFLSHFLVIITTVLCFSKHNCLCRDWKGHSEALHVKLDLSTSLWYMGDRDKYTDYWLHAIPLQLQIGS